ncbi:MAG: zinc-ribbon domain-containing protein [Myxococcales bacterium]|nr:zinc-ribbon domain-containing protein [Myxococcales bacterium]
MSSTPKFCAECGAPLQAGAKFCAGCGAKVGAAAAVGKTPDGPVDPAGAASAASASAASASAASAAAADDEPHDRSHARHSGGQFEDPLAHILEDNADDHLGQPEAGDIAAGKKPFPWGIAVMVVFLVFLIGLLAFIFTDEERSAAIQCRVLGRKEKCETEADRRFALEQAEKREEMELMGHHYGSFDLSVGPEDAVEVLNLTITQRRYEETRADYVKRIRDGGEDKRTAKEAKSGVYSQGKAVDGQIKGVISFAGTAGELTWKPDPVKKLKLLMPLTLANLPLLEKEQADATGKRLSATDVDRVAKELENLPRDDEGHRVIDDAHKIRTTDLSTWVYEIDMQGAGWQGRKVVFYEHPAPLGVDTKSKDDGSYVARKFKRSPDGRFVIDNSSFDLLEQPLTIRYKYVAVLKDLHCVRQTADYKGRTDQGKKDSEDLIWEQKAFTKERRAVAEANDVLATYNDAANRVAIVPEPAPGAPVPAPGTPPPAPLPPYADAPTALDAWKKHVADEIKAYECPKPGEQ